MLRLVHKDNFLYDDKQPIRIILSKDKRITIGRDDKKNDICLDSKYTPQTISRKHARIERIKEEGGDEYYKLYVMGMNGALVNGVKVKEHRLKHGDRIFFGLAPVKEPCGWKMSKASMNKLLKKCDIEYEYVETTSDSKKRNREDMDIEMTKNKVVKRSTSIGSFKVPIVEHEAIDLTGDDEKDNDDNQKETQEKSISNSQNIINEKVNNIATCCICSDLLVLAHTLHCSHTYCLGCITDWFLQLESKRKNSKNTAELSCPQCREKAKNPPVHVLTLDELVDSLLSSEEDKKEYQLRMEEAKLNKSKWNSECQRLFQKTNKSSPKKKINHQAFQYLNNNNNNNIYRLSTMSSRQAQFQLQVGNPYRNIAPNGNLNRPVHRPIYQVNNNNNNNNNNNRNINNNRIIHPPRLSSQAPIIYKVGELILSNNHYGKTCQKCKLKISRSAGCYFMAKKKPYHIECISPLVRSKADLIPSTPTIPKHLVKKARDQLVIVPADFSI